MEEINTKTLNHKFKIVSNDDGRFVDYTSEPATEKEIKDARKDLENHEINPIGRSCWVCNGAHVHMIDRPALRCFQCGRIYHFGIDIMDYIGSKLEKYTHLKK